MITITNTHRWSFKTPCENITKSLNDKLAMYGKDRFATIILGSRDIPSENCVATFSFNSYMGAGLNKRIDVGESVKYDEDNRIIILDTVEDAFYMQHELNHFVHMCVDKGKYIHPNLKGKVYDVKSFRYGSDNIIVKGIKNTRKANEMEVAYRCLLDDINYKVPTDIALIDRHIQKINLMTMENWKKSATKEEIKKYNDMDKETRIKVLDEMCEQISISKIKSDEDTKFNITL